jgi:RNA polymerase-binding transcription factor DksA
MADVGSDNYDQEFTIGIMESERKMLREIDEALARMDRGIYGVCLESGKAIERNRLEAVPWTKYSKVAAERREKQAG